jgi:pSer/pThr/pTyr-binding forkhead associated (FHA) protein
MGTRIASVRRMRIIEAEETCSFERPESENCVTTRAAPDAWLFVIFQSHDLRALPTGFSLARVDRLTVRRGPDASAASMEAMPDSAEVSLFLPDRRASSAHATLSRTNGAWQIEDPGSKNGTIVDGTRITAPACLHDGAIVEIGHTFLCFRQSLPPWPEEAAEVFQAVPELRTVRPDLARHW